MGKKGFFGGTAFVLALMLFSMTAFAAPENRCTTTMARGNRAATGITECRIATACSVYITGNCTSGEEVTSAGHGVVATNAVVRVTSPKEFSAAYSNHRMEYYLQGVFRTYTTSSSAGRN